MSALDRDTLTAFARPRFIAPENVDTAKKQAYMLRTLLETHCGVRLKGGDVTDVFALLYHGMDWAALMANQRGITEDRYYGPQPRDVIHLQSDYLRRILGPVAGPAMRALVEMPRAQYSGCRSVEGARLATLIAGGPSWTLQGTDEVIFDARDGRVWVPVGFSSDPDTNDELLECRDRDSKLKHYIPIELVRYSKPAEEGAEDGLSIELARRWIHKGNTVAACSSIAASPDLISSLEGLSELEANHSGSPAGHGLTLRAVGIDAARDPAERFGSRFEHTRAILPVVEAADVVFRRALETIRTDAEFIQATADYNQVLERAVEAFWLDTREVNSRQSIMNAFSSKKTNQTHLGHAPVDQLLGLIGERRSRA